MQLIHELARGEMLRSQLARKYDVSNSAITQFAKRHRLQIEEVRQNQEDEFAGLWIASKLARLNELEQLYQAGLESSAHTIDERRIRKELLRAASEELGQIPNKAQVSATVSAEVRLVGIDAEGL